MLELLQHEAGIPADAGNVLVEGVAYDVADSLEPDQQLIADIQVP